MEILLTGGTGYVGSHCCVALIKAGWRPVIIDNLCNSRLGVLNRIAQITGVKPKFIKGDIRDQKLLEQIFRDRAISAVMHLAGLKAVGDSVNRPLDYFSNNVCGTLSLLSAMRAAEVKTFVFSSSATVYGTPKHNPITEDFPRHPVNPYGNSKRMVEDILEDIASSDSTWRIARLRYFNPVGAHESGLIGDDPDGIPDNLMPFVAQVALARHPYVTVFGNDYPTRDGTGVRDYVHVMDLVEAHLAALGHLLKVGGVGTLNLGTGRGYSVLELVDAFERAIPVKIAGRRPGDIAEYWAYPTLAHKLLGWKAKRSLDQMCADAWRWQRSFLPESRGADEHAIDV